MFFLAVLSVSLAGAAVNTVYAQQSTTFTLLIPDQEDSSLSNDMKEKSQTALTGSANGQPSNNNQNNMKPSDNKNPVNTTNTTTNSKASKTGDNSAIMLWLFMALIALGGITVCIMRFGKQK